MAANLVTRELTDLQKGFVCHYIANGGKTAKALTAAGSLTKSPGVDGSKMLRIPHVREAIIKAATESLNLEMLVKALNKVGSLVDSKEQGIALTAARDLLDRAGFKAQERVTKPIIGSIVIDLSRPSDRVTIDGTHSTDGNQGEGVLKTKTPPTTTPPSRTTDIEYEEVSDIEDL